MTDSTTDFGFTQVPVDEKVKRVGAVFESVAAQYDVMNDLMSFGIHRVWKQFAVAIAGFRSGQTVLDLAGGTGDLAIKIQPLVRGNNGGVTLADINPAMLEVARERLLDNGLLNEISLVEANAEALPFAKNHFDRIIIGFGLRNVTDKLKALQSMYQVLKPGGQCLVLEFSKPTLPLLKQMYDAYSFKILPKLGALVANDAASYQYLAESIRMHPNQEALRELMLVAGFDQCRYHNLTGGIVAVHQAIKF